MKSVQVLVVLAALLLASSILAHATTVDPNIRAMLEEAEREHEAVHVAGLNQEEAFQRMEDGVDAESETAFDEFHDEEEEEDESEHEDSFIESMEDPNAPTSAATAAPSKTPVAAPAAPTATTAPVASPAATTAAPAPAAAAAASPAATTAAPAPPAAVAAAAPAPAATTTAPTAAPAASTTAPASATASPVASAAVPAIPATATTAPATPPNIVPTGSSSVAPVAGSPAAALPTLTPAVIVPAAGTVPPSPVAAGLALPLAANPEDKVCGCWNGGKCETPANKCICTIDWEGTYCERASAAVLGRKRELERVAQLTDVVRNVALKIKEIEAQTGTPEAIQKLVKAAADKELDEQTVFEASKLFYKSLSQNDVYTARRQLGLLKHISPSKYEKMREELVANEVRLHKEIKDALPKPQFMKEAVTHPEAYRNIDVSNANNLSIKTFKNANGVIDEAIAAARQFNLDFGDNV